jgi:peroxiredoxin
LQESLDQFEAQGTTVLGISKYGAGDTLMWLSKNDWTFPILVDGGPAIREYGIPNPDHDGTEREGIPHPATIIVDTDGVVRFVNVWVNYRDRTAPKEILSEISRLAGS